MTAGSFWKRIKGALKKFVRTITDVVIPVIQTVSVALTPVLPGVATALGLVATAGQAVIKGIMSATSVSNANTLGSYAAGTGDKFMLTYQARICKVVNGSPQLVDPMIYGDDEWQNVNDPFPYYVNASDQPHVISNVANLSVSGKFM